MNLSPAWLGFIRAAGTSALLAVLTYIGSVEHLNGVVNGGLATILAGLAMAFEHAIENKTGNAMFGAIRPRQ